MCVKVCVGVMGGEGTGVKGDQEFRMGKKSVKLVQV